MRVVDRVGERRRQADRHGDAEGVAESTGVLGDRRTGPRRRSTRRRPDGRDASADDQRGGVALAADVELLEREGAEQAEQVVDLVGVAGPAALDQALQLELEVGEHLGVDAARAAPRSRAARAAGRGRAPAPPPGARPAACRPRTCRPRSSRTAATAPSATPAPSRPARPGPGGCGCRARTSSSAGRSNTSLTHSRVVSSRIGKVGYLAATFSRSAARWRCCHSGLAPIGPAAGQEQGPAGALPEAGGEHRRVRAAGRARCRRISSGGMARSSTGSSSTASGRRSTMPSSDQIISTSTPHRSPSVCCSAMAHGACTWAPNGDRTQTRQSPISSRKRSTTMVRSSGTTPVASACSSR